MLLCYKNSMNSSFIWHYSILPIEIIIPMAKVVKCVCGGGGGGVGVSVCVCVPLVSEDNPREVESLHQV